MLKLHRVVFVRGVFPCLLYQVDYCWISTLIVGAGKVYIIRSFFCYNENTNKLYEKGEGWDKGRADDGMVSTMEAAFRSTAYQD